MSIRRKRCASPVLALAAAVAALGAVEAYRLRPKALPAFEPGHMPVCEWQGAGLAVRYPGRFLVAEAGRADNELVAYLMADYLRGRAALEGVEVLLTYEETQSGPVYPIRLVLPGDVLAAVPVLARIQASGLAAPGEHQVRPAELVARWRLQDEVFSAAYRLPVRQALENIPRRRMRTWMAPFLRFKSLTDPRVRARSGEAPTPLSPRQAHRLAADILAVADFYGLPLEFFLGIGAMENNYMNARGDIGHAVWKRRAEKDDIVLERRRGRVLVLNESSGVWQITRETLRYTHKLYLADGMRDYTQLPERLIPPPELDVANVDPEVLTTYAGLLFRDLLDRFDGDVAKAVGAYNGGPANPNEAYANGVTRVASYARRILEQAAALNGRTAPELRLARAAAGPPRTDGRTN